MGGRRLAEKGSSDFLRQKALEMPNPSITSLILGSAAVGALVSSGMTLLGQWRERKARRDELLLVEANKLAMAHHAAALKIAEMTRQDRFIPEHVKLTHTYYVGLRSLLATGKLPKGMFAGSSWEDKYDFLSKYGS